MRLIAFIITIFLKVLIVPAHCADTNILVIPGADKRAGAIFFVDECLTRGLTNSISLGDLRQWATNTIQLYQRRESVLARTKATQKRYPSVLAADVPESVRTIQTRIPSCRSSEPTPQIVNSEKFLENYSKVLAVSKEEAEKRLRTIGPEMEPPKVGFFRAS